QNKNPAGGLWFADLSLTLGKGLFIDERRAILKQARLIQQSADYEVQLALNDLYYQAMNQYWEWYRTYRTFLLYQDAVDLSQERFRAVRQLALFGDIPFIDTLEAHIQVQTRTLSLQKATVSLTNAARQLENYLWLDGQVPLELEETTFPVFERSHDIPVLQDNWMEEHPLA